MASGGTVKDGSDDDGGDLTAQNLEKKSVSFEDQVENKSGCTDFSNVFCWEKEIQQVSRVSDYSRQDNYDFRNPELNKHIGLLEKISDLILNDIPKAEYVSLLNDYVESEFFLIDGDSLFITCISEQTLLPGQNLHFFYLVERFLLDLSNKGAKYVIVFFKDAEHVYFRHPTLLSLRTALILHLQHNTDAVIHTEFSNFLEEKWQSFLQESYPYFIIISDDGLTKLQTSFLNLFIIHALSKRINIVLTSGQESDFIRVYGYHIHGMYKHKGFFSQEKSREITPEEAEDLIRMYCLSVVFLFHLPLSQRARVRSISYHWSKQTFTFIQMHKGCEFFLLKHLTTEKLWKVDFTHLPDLSDDLLWKNVAYYYEVENEQGLNLDMGEKIKREYEYLWSIISKLSGKDDDGKSLPLRRTSISFLEKRASPTEESKNIPNLGLIPMTSMVVDEFAGDILSSLPFLKSDDSAVTSLVKQKEFDEIRHWHSGKLLSDDYDRTKSSSQAMCKDPRALRSNQKLQSFLRFYGSSLEGNISKTIVTQLDTPKKAYSDMKNSKKIHKTKAEIIIEENQKRMKAEEERKEQKQWDALSIEKLIQENFNLGIRKLEDFLKKCQSNSVKCTAEMAGLNTCFEMWIEQCKDQGKRLKDINAAVEVMRRIHSLLEKYKDLMEKTDYQKIVRCLRYFGFDNLACTLESSQIPEDDRKEKKAKISKYSVGMGAARFQLQYMGHCLLREERTDRDPRIQHFIPDTWQRDLLDVVDNNESAVIVAPTSSGKTYASYYCMEKILKESNEGVVVYVAPTKALVNQVWATVYTRFNKTLPDGMVVCGVFTRDFRHDALNCQVLVTVPQCLEILLLSPHRQQWVKRIRYVIFDEVHCLGGEIGAEVWEHLLVMIRCPFLALSATISNPKHLTEWLQSVKRYWQHVESVREESLRSFTSTKKGTKKQKNIKTVNKSYKVKLVLYGERYNDLEKYVCSLEDNDFKIHHYHPCAALTVDHIDKYGFPSDLAFSPRESILLYDSMVQVWENWPRADELDPEKFTHFKNKIVITKADARKYEEELKEELKNWIVHDNRMKANRVLKLLKPQRPYCSEKDMKDNFPCFVEKLRQMDKLPALFFLFDIKKVEKWAENIKNCLEKKQKSKQIPKTEKQIHLLTNRLKKKEKSMQKNQTVGMKITSSKTDKMILEEAEHGNLMEKLGKLTEIPPDCTYANSQAVDTEILQKVMDRVKFMKTNTTLKTLALRGIGYHHASVEQRGRQLVEMLFRMGFIQVVTATGTLALGINMPCKSVVFTQNSVYLDALNYRQMSGRAGRRGQDLLGNVFFYDIPLPKVDKLIKSNVPQLRGQFPLNISLALRLMLLAAKADDKEDAKAKVLSLLKHSLLSFNQPRVVEILKLYFLFSLQFLVKEGYLDQEGNTMGFAGLVTHLHYHEPSSLVLVSFLVKGLFHKLCQPRKDSKTFSKEVMEQLVLVLANLFGRRYIPASVIKSKQKFYQSKVFLEDLPEDFAVALHEFNNKIEENFGHFLLIISKMADMKQEYQLPLSRIDFSSEECNDSKLVSHLMSCNEGRTAVSPFACLSGNVDSDLLHAETVNSVILRTVGITAGNIPVLCAKKFDNRRRRMPLNAYALDFYKHGSLTAMAQDNGIHEGEAYLLLKDFSLTIKAISVSLSELCDDEEDNVVQAFSQLSDSYWEKLQKV
ncbi:probable ATP-dependent RNA helicase DDX60 isoform X3 [Trachemys scripta elegans]|uniref:probable ATP-dependent RNA helicase DDX60 isoform X3 n=1 Tax=Trachemys scripta elegans TaxID=31138 RepID=UPI0015558BBF|nr:probable ATP-dependent RNA helicase DDX60 isoform X3 [Trachemys scripta elegans]